MPAGGPGDHPLTDILQWNCSVYGDETDLLIRKIGILSSKRELFEWWETTIGWKATSEEAFIQAKIHYEEVLQRAKQSGWETSEFDTHS